MPVIGVARQVQAGNGGGARLHFGQALRMAHGVLRHGARPAGDAREAGGRGDAGDLLQFAVTAASDGFVRFVQRAGVSDAAQEAARHDFALGHAIRKLGADPGAGHQAAAFFLGHQEAEADRRAAQIGGVEAQRHGHRRTVAHRAQQFGQARVHGA